MKKSKLVMVGNGMAGVRALEELLRIAPELYDITVFGAEPHPTYNRILLSPGKDLQDVIAYRDIADTNAMIDASVKYKKAVVIGGGLLGLEAANGLMLRGMDVSVLHIMPTLIERQLDTVAGKLLQKSLEDRGLKFLMGAQTQELVGGPDGREDGVGTLPRVKTIRF